MSTPDEPAHASPPQFWLKVLPLAPPSSAPGVAHHDGGNADGSLYLRLHGSGHAAVMLMPLPPIFMKSHLSATGRVMWIAAERAPRRKWGVVLRASGTAGQRAGWEPVEIVEGEGDEGFEFVDEGSGEELVWKGRKGVEDGGDAQGNGWKGWMYCDWAYGHRQLFWVTDTLKEEVGLPAGAERVRIVREML